MKKQKKIDILHKIANTPIFKHFEKLQNIFSDWEQQEKELKEYPLYNLTVDELKQTEKELLNTQTELENIKKEFRAMYDKLQPKPITKTPPMKYYSFNCDLSRFGLRKLHTDLSVFFDCNFEDFINIFSEDIRTFIIIKEGVKLVDVVRVFVELYERKDIKNKNWQSVIYNSECILYKDKPLTKKQLKNANHTARQSLKKVLK